ncbi:hypothetical protein PAL_GLEAN10009770 [Pteropus alecto]|uniref:Uncharacterized protein n=1 Tax=Pteropus alecto TaxID=9402 RepID=L5KS02_PTEAL|nr:hypothetical protein PAL_GLEAN10009770 [Pteropus alecto]
MGRSKDTWDIVGNVLLLTTNDSIEPARSSLWPVRLPTYWGAAMTSVSTATALLGRPRPGRSRTSRGAGQRREIDFRGTAERALTWRRSLACRCSWRMITKTHKEDLGLGLPEKKKKKKVVAKEAETQSWVLNSDNYSTEVRPSRARSPSKSVVQGPAPKMSSVKKKKKKKKSHSTVCEEHLESEARVRARRTEASPSPRGQALGSSRLLSGEKKKKKSLRPLATSPGSTGKTSPDPTEGEEVTKVGKKPKKHKKEKKAQEAAAVSARDPWFCEAGPEAGSVGQDGQGQAALRHKRKQGSPREHTAKTKKKKKKKKIHQEGDTPLRHPEPSRSAEGSPRKGGEKRPVKAEASEYIPLEDGSRASAKKKTKSGKRAGQPGIQEPAPKRKRRRSRGEGAGSPWEEEPDTDLEVVLEKKGNMDEAHIDQVRRKALQEEIDRESGKTETSETRKSTVSLMLELCEVTLSTLNPSPRRLAA